jgi:hypothetical protein
MREYLNGFFYDFIERIFYKPCQSKMSRKRGQVSTEYLVIVGFVVFLIIAVMGVGFLYSTQIADKIRTNQVRNFANKIVSGAEDVFYRGSPSRTQFTVYLPSGVQNLELVDDSLVFNVTTSSGVNTVSFESDVPIQFGAEGLSYGEGVKRIEIKALTDYAEIGEVTD